ncbi:hypothetical protein FSP39_021631 [Pinctada imbricata]|uniref:Ig-like domain-containing protein n=1 Tax=Pinctada imbricata TaxID=66713 RepID=A0AA88YLB9_PINIB|nr:hypothetical protein FSP39_021631 [Pinctada imbricata]
MVVYGGLTMIPQALQILDIRHSLDLSKNSISELSFVGTKFPADLKELFLTDNQISVIHSYSLHKLSGLEVLDLGKNKITIWPEDTFTMLRNLRVLDLSYNQIRNIPVDTFDGLEHLEKLKFGHNFIYTIPEGMLGGLPSLQSLSLENNRIWKIPENVVDEFQNIAEIKLFGNPFDCSCDVRYFHNFLLRNADKFSSNESIECQHPPHYLGMHILNIDRKQYTCVVPNITHHTGDTDFLVKNDISLKCRVDGHPKPIIYWRTPWDKIFTNEKFMSTLANDNITGHSTMTYKFDIGFFQKEVAVISVNEENDLEFKPFHARFYGTFTCVAINSEGSVNATIDVLEHSAIPNTYVMSLIIGGVTSVFTLAAGLIIGAIKLCIINFCMCKCVHRTIIKSAAYEKTMRTENNEESQADDSCNSIEDSDDDKFDDMPPDPPLNSPVGRTPRSSPLKCPTPTTDPSDRMRSGNISDTLDEVKLRLEKKIEKVRSRYHSMKESGSQYLSSIKGTGSTAANRVKAGVVMGMEQVKFGVQSMKEFCGTGDMGMQTISIISVDDKIKTESEEKTEAAQSTTKV